MGVAGKRARRSPSRPGFVDSTARGLSFAMSHGARKTEDDPAKWEAEAAVGDAAGEAVADSGDAVVVGQPQGQFYPEELGDGTTILRWVRWLRLAPTVVLGGTSSPAKLARR